MTQRTTTTPNDQFLRRAFDFLYTVSVDDIRDIVDRVDRRTRWLAVSIIASAVLLIVVVQLAQAGIAAVVWANRPSLDERLTAPYELEARLQPMVDLNTLGGENPPALLPLAAGSFALQPTANVPSILEQCLLSADGKTKADCTMSGRAVHLEMGTYMNAVGDPVNVVMALFETEDAAATALLEMYRYSRSIGRIGNYVLLPSRTVDYYYSSTRERFSFSWSNGPWVYMASGPNFEALEQLMAGFAY